jgi:hypothetical protein
MITTDSAGGAVGRKAFGRAARVRAGWRGRRDGTRGIPSVPWAVRPFAWQPYNGAAHGPAPDGVLPDPDLVVTAYVMEVRSTARLAAEQLRSALIAGQRELISRLRAESVRVVTQYDVRQDPMPAALARFGHWVGQWTTSTDLCRSHAQDVVEQANRQLGCYWAAVRKAHPHLVDPKRGEPTRWLPGKVELDESWHRPGIWLLSDDGGQAAVTSRALRILEEQNIRRPAGRIA